MPWKVLSSSQGWELGGPVQPVPLHVLPALGAAHGAPPPSYHLTITGVPAQHPDFCAALSLLVSPWP